MKKKRVTLVLNVSIDLQTSAESVKLAQTYNNVLAAVGIHPGEAIPPTAEVKKRLEELAGQKRVVALGEIGLSYGRSSGSQEAQRYLFAFQIHLANNMHKPVDLHYSHESHQAIIAMVKKEKGLSGIVHDGFQASPKAIQEWLDLGFYISIGQASLGMSKGLHGAALTDEAVRSIPAARLITETDSMARMSVSRWKAMGLPRGAPTDMPKGMPAAPPPAQEEFRQPADVVGVAEKIASIRGIPAAEIGDIATKNLKHILKVK
jgi:TatD DNase family protein